MAAKETLSYPETNFFVSLENKATFKSRAFGKTTFYTWRYRKWLRHTGLPVRDTLCRDQFDCGRKFSLSMDELARNAGKNGWMEKSPKHIWHVETIQRSIPDVKFIHIVRSARQNIGSLLEWASLNRRTLSPADALELWLKHYGRTARYHGHSSHLVVSYDELTNNFDSEMKRVSRFIGISVPALQDLDLRRFSQQIIQDHEVWKQKNLAEAKPRDSGLLKYEKWVTGRDRQGIEDSIRCIEGLLRR